MDTTGVILKSPERKTLSLPVSDTGPGLFNFMIQVQYENNLMGQLTYTRFGGPHVPRERLEIFCGDKYVELIDFKKLGVNGKTSSVGGGMGHVKALEVFQQTICGKSTPVALSDMMAASWTVLMANRQYMIMFYEQGIAIIYPFD